MQKYAADPTPDKLSTKVKSKAPEVPPVAPHPSMAPVAAAATKGQYRPVKVPIVPKYAHKFILDGFLSGINKKAIAGISSLYRGAKSLPVLWELRKAREAERLLPRLKQLGMFERARELGRIKTKYKLPPTAEAFPKAVREEANIQELLSAMIAMERAKEIGKGVGLYGAGLGVPYLAYRGVTKEGQVLPKALMAAGMAGLLGTAYFSGKEMERIERERETEAKRKALMRQQILQRLYGIK